jgi:hypothetical protein
MPVISPIVEIPFRDDDPAAVIQEYEDIMRTRSTTGKQNTAGSRFWCCGSGFPAVVENDALAWLRVLDHGS